MLRDHHLEQQRRTEAARRSRKIIREYGDFIRNLMPWCWFATITFRDPHRDADPIPDQPLTRSGKYTRCQSDPRLLSWRPSSRYGSHSISPSQHRMIPTLQRYLTELQEAAGQPIAWVIGEDLGGLGGRFHCHLLIAGVNHLSADLWRSLTLCRFGRTTIEQFDKARGGAHYLAERALTSTGAIHFGGDFMPENLAQPVFPVGRVVVARSADVPTAFFHMTLGRRRNR